MQRLQQLDMDKGGGMCFREIIACCLLDIAKAQQHNYMDHRCAEQFRTILLEVQTNFEKLFDDADQPISFAYYHFACFLSAVYLPLFAMSSALDAGVGDAAYWVTDVVSGLIVCLQANFCGGITSFGGKSVGPVRIRRGQFKCPPLRQSYMGNEQSHLECRGT